MGNDNISGEDEPTPSRRRLLQAAGAMGAVGLSGTAAATTGDTTARRELREVAAEFDSQQAVEHAFDTHAGELLEVLSDEGFLDGQSVNALHVAESTTVGGINKNGQITAHIQTAVEYSTGTLTAAIEPHSGEAYAFFDPVGEDNALIINPSKEQTVRRDVNANSHCPYCGYGGCDGWWDLFYDCTIWDTCGTEWRNTGQCCYCG